MISHSFLSRDGHRPIFTARIRATTVLSWAPRAQKMVACPSPPHLRVPPPNPYTDAIAIQPGLNSPARSSIN